MDKAARTISYIVKTISEKAQPGVSLLTLEKTAADLIDILGAQSALKNYAPPWANKPYPSVICLNVNDGIGHGIPTNYVLKDGDLLTIDCGIINEGFAGDCGITVAVGSVSERDKRLLRYTKQTFLEGMKQVFPGNKVTEVGRAMEKYAKKNGFVINKRMSSHGIGKTMHEEPTIPNYDIGQEEKVTVDEKGKKHYAYTEYENIPVFQIGQVVCLEPYLSYKDEYGKLEVDQWTLKTRDGRKSAMLEHEIRVTINGSEILTTHE